MGDVDPVGEGISELSIHIGAGWRMYFTLSGVRILAAALGDIARSREMTEVAKAAGITRNALYKALRPDNAPRFDTVNRVCAALGVRLVAQAVHD
jgi:probable addiction module antidote protein